MKCRSSYPPIKDRTDKLVFGQYKGNTVSWVLENDPDYIIWMYDESVCKVDKKILDDAERFSEEKHYCDAMDARWGVFGNMIKNMDFGLDYGTDDD